MKRKGVEDWELIGSGQLGTVEAVVEAFKLLRIHSRVIEGITPAEELAEAQTLLLHLTALLTTALRLSLGAPATGERLASHYSRGKKDTALTAPTKTNLTKPLTRSHGWSKRQLKLFDESPEKPKLPRRGPSLH